MRKINIALLFLVSNTIFFIILATLLPLQYETNDDLFMCLLANGKITGSPEFHLVYINSIYGFLLSLMYNTFSGVEWYTITFCVLHVIAMTYISYCLFFSKRKALLRMALLLFIYILWARIIISFQFTTTAGLLAFAGCLALTRGANKHFIIGALFLLIASMIRFQAAGLVGIMMLPCYIQNIKDKSFVIRMSVLLSMIMGCVHINNATYSAWEWKYYIEYDRARSRCYTNDNPNAYLASNFLPQGISQNDFMHLLHSNPDPSIIDLNAIKEIRTTIKSRTEKRGFRCIKNLKAYTNMEYPPYIPIIILTILFAIALTNEYNNHDLYVLLLGYLLFIIVFVCIGCFSVIKNRVFICMILPATYIAVSKSTKKIIPIISVLFILSVFFAKQTYDERMGRKQWNTNLQTYYWPLLDKYSDRLLWPCLGIETYSPFKYYDMPYNIIHGSSMRYPQSNNFCNSYSEVLSKKPLFVVRNSSLNEHSITTDIIQGLKEHYGIDAMVHVIQENIMYKVVEISPTKI